MPPSPGSRVRRPCELDGVAATTPSPAGGWLSTVSDEVFTLDAPPETRVRASKVSGELKISVAPESAVVGAAESVSDVPLTLAPLVPAAIPGPTTDCPAVTLASVQVLELVMLPLVTLVVDPLTFPTAVRVVNVSVWPELTAAEVSAESTMVVAVTLETEVPDASEAPYAPMVATTPVVLEHVRVVELVLPVQPLRFTTGSVEKAAVPLAMVGGVSAPAGPSNVMAAAANTPAVSNKAETALKITVPRTCARLGSAHNPVPSLSDAPRSGPIAPLLAWLFIRVTTECQAFV